MKKNKRLIIVIFFIFVISFSITYIKPVDNNVSSKSIYTFNDNLVDINKKFDLYLYENGYDKNVYKDNYVEIHLQTKLGKCNVKSIINNIDSNLDNYLLKEEYKKSNENFYKEKEYNISCDKIAKDFINTDIYFSLKGKEEIDIEVKSEYKDEGYISNSKNVIKLNEIDTNKLGTDYLVYKLDNEIYDKYLIRKINIVDTTKPTIILNKPKVTVYLNEEFKEPGFKATDNYDGNITDKVKVKGEVNTKKEGKYELVYEVTDSSNNLYSVKREVTVTKKQEPVYTVPTVSDNSKLTYINGILLVNKKYKLPKDYNPGINQTAYKALSALQADAKALGFDMSLLSGFRSYSRQTVLYNNYVKKDGQAKADTYSARPGTSEHQTGLAFDVGQLKYTFGDTPAGKWLAQNCHLYGFIIRYPKGKTHITGYVYEPWHIRYVGKEHATKIMNNNLTLEEYLGVN